MTAGTEGAGGTGGGGAGGRNGVAAIAGTTNTGGGGGGSGVVSAGANGGSGIVIIAYLDSYPNIVSFSAGLIVNGVTTTGSNVPAPDIASRSGYKVYKFTSGTGTIQF
jgi:hypothetical protein